MVYRELIENRHHERTVAATANAAWQRGRWVSYWPVANVLEHLKSPVAAVYWRKAYDKLAGMAAARQFVSPQDRQFLVQPRTKCRM